MHACVRDCEEEHMAPKGWGNTWNQWRMMLVRKKEEVGERSWTVGFHQSHARIGVFALISFHTSFSASSGAARGEKESRCDMAGSRKVFTKDLIMIKHKQAVLQDG